MPRIPTAQVCTYRGAVTSRVQIACAVSAAWLTASMRGHVSIDDALDTLTSVTGKVQFWPPADLQPDGLPHALQRWRQLGISGWRYAPAATADTAGLPGPPAFVAAAVDTGAVLVSLDGAPVGLIAEPPEPHGVVEMSFREVSTEGHGHVDHTTLADADREFLAVLTDAISTVERLDVAAWQDDVVAMLRDTDDVPATPPGWSERARRLAARSHRVLEIVDLASQDAGGSRTAGEATVRSGVLRGVATAARHAHAVAWNTGIFADERRR